MVKEEDTNKYTWYNIDNKEDNMEEKKNNNTLTTVVITILVILVLGLGGFIGYDKLINKTDNESNTTTESKECDCPEIVEEEKGKCPFTKVDSSYVLTDQDKDDIIESLSIDNADSKEYIKKTMRVENLSYDSYYIRINFETAPPTPYSETGSGALIIKVNGKFKVLDVGTSFSYDTATIMDDILARLCK